MINGGSHAGNKLAMQEFMVLPVGAESFKYTFRYQTTTFFFFFLKGLIYIYFKQIYFCITFT